VRGLASDSGFGGAERCNAPRERMLEMLGASKRNLWFTGYISSGVSQVGPPFKGQAVTNPIVAAFSFVLNTNPNQTQKGYAIEK